MLPLETFRLPEQHPLSQMDALDVAAATFESWFERGVVMASDGKVLAVDSSPDGVVAIVASAQHADGYVARIEVICGELTSACDCPVSGRHRVVWCKHRVALGVSLIGTGPYGELTFREAGPDDHPISWTGTTATGTVRHRTRRVEGRSRARCGSGPVEAATRDLPLCRRCYRT